MDEGTEVVIEKMSKKKPNILDEISADEAFSILRTIAEEDKAVRKRIEQIAKKNLCKVDLEEVAESVFGELDSIEIEDVWDNSGSTRDGYVDPDELAWEMFEEALKPFIEALKRYKKLSMNNEGKIYCMGILKGLHKFKEESTTDYMDYIEDAPKESFETVLDEWKKGQKNSKDAKEMKEFIKENFPG